MVNSLYRFSEVEAKTAKPSTVYGIIKDLLKADDDACWVEMETYLRGAANTGSSQFDHAYSVNILLDHDKMHGGHLHVVMTETQLSKREIWDRLNRVVVSGGFKFQNGKLIGLHLEDNSADGTEAA